MLQIDKTIISFDILEKNFLCDLTKCRGACCIHGDSGAPLKKEEARYIEDFFPEIKKFMRKEGVATIENEGFYTIDKDGDMVTPLINNEECAFVYFEKNIAKCAIEKAYEEKKISFKKPISCHLYPIRVTEYTNFAALNFHSWDICKDALQCGNKIKMPLYIFLKEPLIREYGEGWYKQLEIAASEYKTFKNL